MRRLGLVLAVTVAAGGLFALAPYRAALHVLLCLEGEPSALADFAAWGRPALEVTDATFEGARHRVYRPAGEAEGVIVLLHGMHRLGIDEPRLVSLARALAETGHVVHTPELPRLAAYRLDEAEAERIGEVIARASAAEGGARVGVFAISFSGGLALLSATEPETRERIASLLVLGSYADLVRVTRFYAGEEARSPDGTPSGVRPHPYGIEILLRDSLAHWAPDGLADTLGELLRLSLHDEFRAADALAETLPAPWAERMRALLRGEPDAHLREAALAHVARHEAVLRLASPAGRLAGLDRPVYLLHGFDDPVIPATESEHLARDLDGHAHLLVSRAMRHAEHAKEAPLEEKLALLAFVTSFLRSL